MRGSPWEVTLDQIKRCLDENNIEFVDNQAISICITQINLQRTFRYCDLEECPFFQVNGIRGLYRSTACQLPDLKTRIQDKIRTILEQNYPVGLEISEIKELVPDQASLSEDLLGSNRSRVKTALDELVANGIVKRTERQRPILYYISEVEQ